MNVWVSIDRVAYESKPAKEDAGAIRRRAARNWVEADVEKLALYICEGHAFVPGHLVGGEHEKDCTEMQLFVLDFDKNISFMEVYERCQSTGLAISFAYHTYSNSPEIEKFRVAFALNEPLKDTYAAKIILLMLHKIFPECDKQCKDLSRLFYGGKDVIFIDSNARMDLVQMCRAFNRAMDCSNKNYTRDMRNFCTRNHILMTSKGRPMMGSLSMISAFGNFDDFKDSINIHIIEEDAISSFFIVENKDWSKNGENGSVGRSTHTSVPKSYVERKLVSVHLKSNKKCQLLNDFRDGVMIEHNTKLAILTNMLWVKGGEDLFFDVLLKYYTEDTWTEWKRQPFYMEGYFPQRCSENFCPYFEICDCDGTIVATLKNDRSIHVAPETYYTLEETRTCLKQNLEKAIMSKMIGIHLIRAQTAAGKTRTYIDLIVEHPELKFLIALPTNILKYEVYEKLCYQLPKESVFMTPSANDQYTLIPKRIQYEISNFHEAGIHNMTKQIIKEFYNKVKEETPEAIALLEACEALIEGIDAVKDQRVIVTTHAYMQQLPAEFLSQYTIIVDEDILQKQFFNSIKTVPLSTLEIVSEQNIGVYSAIASEIINTQDDVYTAIQPHSFAGELSDEQKILIEHLDGNVCDLVRAESFVRIQRSYPDGSVEKEVHYFCPGHLYQLKYIVLSATVNTEMYKRYFKKQEIQVYDSYPEIKAKYRGTLLQWTYHSMSRTDLSEKKDVFYYACDKAGNEKLPFITFVRFKGKETLKDIKFSDLHFGNSIGVNSLEGKDIGIVGTYFQQEQAYKLVALYLGANVNNPTDKEGPRRRRVSYKNKEFLISTYDDPLLRELQLYSIESEMEQSVGRARLLSRDCTVYLFSCFPCEQAQLNTGNYLLNYYTDRGTYENDDDTQS